MPTIDPELSFSALKDSVIKSVSSYFPYEGRNQRLVLKNIWADDKLSVDDLRSQAEAKDKEKTWGVPIKGDLELIDKATGKVIDSKTMTLSRLPKMTPRYGFIVDGNEYQVDHLFRLKSGVYARIQQNGDIKSEFNLASGNGFSVFLDRKKKQFQLKMGSTHIPLYPIMKSLGVHDDELQAAWGKEILDANRPKDQNSFQKSLSAFYAKTSSDATPSNETNTVAHIKDWFSKTQLRPDTTKVTLGKAFDTVNGETLQIATAKLLGVARGTQKPDDRDNLSFKEVVSVEDFIPEKIKRADMSIKGRLRHTVDRKKSVLEIVSPDLFARPVMDFFKKSGSITERSEQTNPLQMLAGHHKTTLIAPDFGGMKSEHSLIDEMRVINPSHFGFLDPMHTPESSRTGITLHMNLSTQKIGKDLVSPVYDKDTKSLVYLNPAQFHDAKVVLPDQVRWDKGVPKPISSEVKMKHEGGDIHAGKFSEARYVMPSTKGVFGIASNLIPFLPCDQGNRVSMADKQMEQAISLKHREAPLVQSIGPGSTTFEHEVGRFTATSSPVDGKIVAVKKDAIVVSDGKKRHEVHLYDHFPLNDAKGMLHSTPVVQVGDSVKKGQLIADSNYTKDGTLALGTNLRVGYIPYKGYNFEDGIVISETAAKKLTSEHLHRRSLDIDPDTDLISKSKFLVHASLKANAIPKDHIDALDEEGIIKPGSKVMPGQIMVASLKKNTQRIAEFGKRSWKPWKDNSVTWDEDHVGEVIKVVKSPTGKDVKVYVKTEEPLVVGDKLSGRHGNKGIVTMILPDHEMPHTKDEKGDPKPLEVLLNPHGVPSRINVGQVMETAVGKIAEKTGKTYKVDNFAGPGYVYHEQVSKEMKANGLSDEEIVYDPKDPNHALGSVLVGPHYLMKLKHQVEKKLSVRGGGTDLNKRALPVDVDRQPTRGSGNSGQSLGQLDAYVLMGHNARANLREAATYKSDLQDGGFWSMIQEGHDPPTPKVPFAYEKFIGLLKGLGVNVEKNGTKMRIQPLTDKEIIAMAGGPKGEIKNANMTLRAKDLREEKHGLFDVGITGGRDGNKWGFIRLNEPIPNPIFVGSGNQTGPVPTLLNMKLDDVEGVMRGDVTINGKTGGHAIESALKNLDVDREISSIREKLKTVKRGAELDRANKKLRYLLALKEVGMKPHEAYVLHTLPVLPPVFRPVTETENGDVHASSLNGLYKNIAVLNQKVGEFDHSIMPEEMLHPLRHSLYDSVKAFQSVGGTVGYDTDSPGGKRSLKGILAMIGGGEKESGEKTQPKEGYFQSKLVKRRQNLSIRSTIIPEPKLSLDELGLPKNAAMELYKPYVVVEMKKMGINALDAQEHMRKGSDIAFLALEKAVTDRPLMLKRDPALHKFSIMAFKPKLIEGKAIQIHPLVCGGFNADFDGDQELGTVFLNLFNGLDSFLKSCHSSVSIAWPREWWDARRAGEAMAARFREKVGIVAGGELFLVNLEDFPHEGAPIVKDHIEFFNAPPGIQVVSYSETQGRLILATVSHWSRHKDRKVELVNLASGRQIVTDDDPRAVYGLNQNLEFVRARPKDAVGMFVPVAHTLDLQTADGLVEVTLPDGDSRLKPSANLDGQLGRLLGTLAGDGWVVTNGGQLKGQVALAAAEASIAAGFSSDLCSVFKEVPNITAYERIGGDFGGSVQSRKYVVSSMAFSKFIEPLIGKGAEQKHLPPFFLTAPKSFRIGLLAGLIDTDGSISISNGKSKPQWMISFASKSIRLSQEIVYLAKSLALRATITASKTPGGEPMWAVGFSTVDFHKLGELPLSDVHKKQLFTQFFGGQAPAEKNSYAQKDVIPTPPVLAQWLRQQIGTSLGQSIYVLLSNAKERGYISRYSAREILEKVPDLRIKLPLWAWMIDNTHVWWDRVVSFEVTNKEETGFDLTVPDYETFMSVDGIVLSNTMSGFVPMSREAVEEAKEMYPSKNLFSPTSGGPMFMPVQESMLGLHLLTKWGKKINQKFDSVADLKRAYATHKIKVDDVVSLNGAKGDTTIGRVMIAEQLPSGFKMNADVLHNSAFTINKKMMNSISDMIAREHPREFSETVDGLKNLGNEHIYQAGFSFGMKDLAPLVGRKAILDEAHKRVEHIRQTVKNKDERDEKIVAAYQDATAQLDTLSKKVHETSGNRMAQMVYTGSKGKPEQLRQMIAAPMLMQDGTGRTLLTPVTRSYSEGLDVGDYWQAQHGARKGTLQRSLGTSEPGVVSKDIINATMSTQIVSKNCGTSQGILMRLTPPTKDGEDDRSFKDVHDRFLAAQYKLHDGTYAKAGDLITPELSAKLRKSGHEKILARSPLKCQHGDGICSKCFGLNENGKLHEVGTNIGVLAGQAMSEPAVQMAMDSFHSGGIAAGRGAESVDRMTRLSQLLEIPKKLKNSATLSRVAGKILSIKKDAAGGHDVMIQPHGGGEIEKHYVPNPTKLKIQVGDEVTKAHPLSDGPVNPRHLLPLSDVHRVQKYLTDEMYNELYDKEGVRRRNVEVVVRSMTNLTKVKDPGTSEFMHGDVTSRSVVDEHNRNIKPGEKPILHEPVLHGIKQVSAGTGSTDWMARLNYQRLSNTIMQGAAQAWKSDIHGSHPIPGYARGSEFGLPPPDVKAVKPHAY